MPWHTIESKIETAIVRVLTAMGEDELRGVQILSRFSGTDLVEPCIQVICPSAAPDNDDRDDYTGNERVTCEIVVRSHYRDTAPDEHDRIVGVCVDFVYRANLTARLNAAAEDMDLTVLLLDSIAVRTNTVDGHNYETRIPFVLLAMPSKQGQIGED